MNEQQRIAYVMSQIVCAQAEIAGMEVTNKVRLYNCARNNVLDPQNYNMYDAAYGSEAFDEVIRKYGLHANTVQAFLEGI